MLAKIISSAVYGIDGILITVEVDVSKGLPVFSTVGLPDASVKESKDRVVSAIKNSGFDFPAKKITVNLAPAELKKEGSSFDLPIAVGILSTQGKILQDKLSEYCLIGELALDGKIRPVKGVLPICISLRENGYKNIILPEENSKEAAVVKGLNVYGAKTLKQVVDFLNGLDEINKEPEGRFDAESDFLESGLDFSEIKGQYYSKRAIEVACAGAHNVLMIGPPGSGKTMIAKRLPTILPPLSFEEAMETTKIHSVYGMSFINNGLIVKRPVRNPHHTISTVALTGGGASPKPGEVSLAHNGVLFLDEFTEFHRDVLEVLRQPLENKEVSISRVKASITYPANFMLVAAMNPCPCGNLSNPARECVCSPHQVRKYRSKISGPILDRIDIHLEIPALKINDFKEEKAGETSKDIRSRIIKARDIQKERYKNSKIYCNAQMLPKDIKKHCGLDKDAKDLLISAVERLGFSARVYDRILRVSRTIADLDNKENIEHTHIAEAVGYRSFDKA